jgi:hypothetical protein
MDIDGQLTIRLVDRYGAVALDRRYHNLIVTSGRLLVARMFVGQPTGHAPPPISWLAIGTGGLPLNETDTDLRQRRGELKELESPEISAQSGLAGSPARARVRLSASYDYGEANGDVPLCEAGLFSLDGQKATMYNRVVFDALTKSPTFRLALIWDIEF